MFAEGKYVQFSDPSDRRWATLFAIAALASWLFPLVGSAYKEATVVSSLLLSLAWLRQHLLRKKPRDMAVARTSSDPWDLSVERTFSDQDFDTNTDLVHLVWVVLGLVSDVNDPLKVVLARDSREVLNNWFSELESASRKVSRQDIILLYHVARSSARCGHGTLLKRALDMNRFRIQATLHMYTDIISRRGKAGDYEGAKFWYQRMQKAGLTGDAQVYSAMIHGAGRSGNLEEAEFWFRTMIKKKLSPSVVTINSMVNACSRSKLPELGERWLQVMDDLGLAPTLITYNSIIYGFANAGQTERAEFWLTEMMRRGVCPDHVSYGAILHSLVRTMLEPNYPHRAVQAHRLMKQLLDRGLVGQRPAYNYKCVIGVCAVAREFDLAEYWMDHAEASGVRLAAGCYRFLERAYLHSRQAKAAKHTRARKVRAEGGKPDVAIDT